MTIETAFPGGNVKVIGFQNDTYFLEPDLRDTVGDWFYWAFKVSGAQGKTLTFKFNGNYVGYYGPAISYDLENWHWQYSEKKESGNAFSYTFDENEVYFAHNYLYTPERFYKFALENNMQVQNLCVSEKNRPIPCLKLYNGENHILLTARHHACESTGNYVLEGVLQELYKNPVPNTTVFCVPFVDYDGVIDGDQGKNRAPHDHYVDYAENSSRYASVKKIQEYAKNNKVILAFDFHSPWHCGGIHDGVFIVRNKANAASIHQFSSILQDQTKNCALPYFSKNDMPADTDWNLESSPCFGHYMARIDTMLCAFSIESCYFGEEDHKFEIDSAVKLGRNFALSVKRFLNEKK